ncbi:MAG: DUF6798 domain-containing protein [Anaerolineales bacterium]
MSSESRIKKITAGPVAFVAWSAVFALVYTQLPLFASNQYQYFLHGLAQAGYGYLSKDWLAGTADPTPVFSALVNITFRIFHSEAPVYVYYGLILGVYFYALYGIADFLFSLRQSTIRSLVFIAAFLALHSTAFRFLLSRIWNGEAAYLFEGGVAEQQVLGQIFQPSVFGVIFLLSILFFLRDKKGWAILSLAVAAYFHSTYLLAGALLTLGYIAAIGWKERSWKSVLGFGLPTLLAVAPILVYDAVNFGPSSLEIYRQAQQILVHYRIPQHALISSLFHWSMLARAGLVLTALVVLRKTRLFPILAVAFLGSLLLTLVVWGTGSDSLALLFPWRISVILVPLSSTLLLAAGLQWIAGRITPMPATVARAALPACLAAISLLLVAGIARFPLDQAATESAGAMPMINAVRAHSAPGDVYVIPPKMEYFRIETGAPVFVDVKSIPYRDTDIVEWYRRLMLVNDFYQPDADRCAKAQVLAGEEDVYLFVIPAEMMPAACPAFKVVYGDADYTVVRILPEPIPQ